MTRVTELGIEPRKITHYLLDLTSPSGWSKAKFFLARGFSRDRPEERANAIAWQAMRDWPGDVLVVPSAAKHRISGPISCPDGSTPDILTVWHVKDGRTTAMLATARPGRLKGA